MKSSQEDKMLHLLQDGKWHDTPEILSSVYGDSHLGIARIGARIHGLKKKGHTIQSRKQSKTIWEYKMAAKNEALQKPHPDSRRAQPSLFKEDNHHNLYI